MHNKFQDLDILIWSDICMFSNDGETHVDYSEEPDLKKKKKKKKIIYTYI